MPMNPRPTTATLILRFETSDFGVFMKMKVGVAVGLFSLVGRTQSSFPLCFNQFAPEEHLAGNVN